MSVYSALYTHLKNASGVAAIVGTRIYPIRAPQSPAYDFLIFSQVGEDRRHTMDKKVTTRTFFDIDCFSKTHEGVVALAAAVTSALDTFVGTIGTDEKFLAVLQMGREDRFEEEVEEEDYRIILTFGIQHVPA
jgi:hypothetical protein